MDKKRKKYIERQGYADRFFSNSEGQTRSKFLEELDKALSQQKKEFEKLAKGVLNQGWHEIGCPAHTDQMQAEKECDCLYGFMRRKLAKLIKI